MRMVEFDLKKVEFGFQRGRHDLKKGEIDLRNVEFGMPNCVNRQIFFYKVFINYSNVYCALYSQL